jgi:tetratricopeptide (TPR) repeat protein
MTEQSTTVGSLWAKSSFGAGMSERKDKSMSKKLLVLSAALVLAMVISVAGIRALSNRKSNSESTLITQPLNARATGADVQIQIAEARIKNFPASPDGYNLLAGAFMQKARETGDFGFNARAETSLDRSLEIAPDDRSALILRATLLLTYHRFREAVEEAKRAQVPGRESPDLYGVMTDALVELGDYSAAVDAAQKMMDLRPDSASYSRASYVRALHGDLEGAIEAMVVAVKAANPRNAESAAWYRVHLGLVLMNDGERAEGERQFDLALDTFPNYHPALAAKARARVAAGDFEGAIQFYRQAQARVPVPEIVIPLGNLYSKLGRADEARQQYELVDFIERQAAGNATYSRELALFWADHDMKLDEALEIMRQERVARADIHTSDALAWCLFKKGKLAEAKESIEQAMRLGTRDARIFYHAGMIYDALNDRQRAVKYLKLALDADFSFAVLQADAAKRKLNELTKEV